MSVRRMVTAIVTGCAAVVISAVPGIAGQTPPAHQHAAVAKAKPASAMDAKCQAMMAEHEKMMADMKAADQRLDELVATMNAASGMEKMVATASVVTEKVTQDRAMRDGMMKMQDDMMGHMMEHMQAGKESMASCSMMKQLSALSGGRRARAGPAGRRDWQAVQLVVATMRP
jgi:hypothetical protein